MVGGEDFSFYTKLILELERSSETYVFRNVWIQITQVQDTPLLVLYKYSYHTRENTVNPNTGKPLYIRRYYTKLFQWRHANVTFIVLAIVFSMTLYEIVMQRSNVVYHGLSHLSLVISWYTKTPKRLCVHQRTVCTNDLWDTLCYNTRLSCIFTLQIYTSSRTRDSGLYHD